MTAPRKSIFDKLTVAQKRIYEKLINNTGNVVLFKKLILDYSKIDSVSQVRTLTVQIVHIRRHLPDNQQIISIRAKGYMLVDQNK